MTTISDEYMQEMIAKTKTYTLVILKGGPNIAIPGVERIIWEHGRRNFALRQQGVLSIVCPVADESGVCGVGIFNTDLDKTKSIMDEEPGVKEKVFTYELHSCRSFPSDRS